VRSEPDTQRFVLRRWFNEGDPERPTLREFLEADIRVTRIVWQPQ
jgi:hypothetical protein